MTTKIKLSLVFSIILMLLFTSCAYVPGKDLKKISNEQLKEDFNRYVTDAQEYMNDNIIKDVDFEYDFSYDSGSIYFRGKDCYMYFNLYLDRENPFGNDYELGIEKYNITYQRDFDAIEDLLSTQIPSFKIMSMLLSMVTGEAVSEEEVVTYFSELKENVKIPDFDESHNQDELINIYEHFKDEYINYYVNYKPYTNQGFSEVIVLGRGGNGYVVS